MSKLSIYCKKCGSPSYYTATKPNFCQSCGTSFGGAPPAFPKEIKAEVVSEEEYVDEEDNSWNLNVDQLDVDVKVWEDKGIPLGSIMASNPDTKPPESKGKGVKPKRTNKKQFLNQWEKEAGSIRKKQNE